MLTEPLLSFLLSDLFITYIYYVQLCSKLQKLF